MARILDVPSRDVLVLLGQVGRDMSGAISFAERGMTGVYVREVTPEEDLEQVVDELPRKPFFAVENFIIVKSIY